MGSHRTILWEKNKVNNMREKTIQRGIRIKEELQKAKYKTACIENGIEIFIDSCTKKGIAVEQSRYLLDKTYIKYASGMMRAYEMIDELVDDLFMHHTHDLNMEHTYDLDMGHFMKVTKKLGVPDTLKETLINLGVGEFPEGDLGEFLTAVIDAVLYYIQSKECKLEWAEE